MRILSHYFVARFLGLFTTVLVASILVLATIELVLNLDDLSAFGVRSFDSESVNPANALRYLWVRLASYYLADLLPLASFVAAFVTFAWAGRSMELTAIQAGGIRLNRIVLPVLLTSLILSLANAFLHETLILQAQQIWASESDPSRDQPDFGRQAFWYHKGRTITNIASANPAERTLHGVEIFERGPSGRIIRVVRADRVQIDDRGVWHVEHAAVWTFDASKPELQPTLEEDRSLALDLDALRGDVLLGADPSILPIRDLARVLASQSTESSSALRRLRTRYHERLCSPWLILAFAWLALPFALRVDERGRIAGPAAAAVSTLGLFFLLQTAGSALSRRELLPSGITPWLAVAVIVIGTAVALQRDPTRT